MNLQTVEAEITVTADDADAFVNTDLRYTPGPGAIAIYLVSTVADSRATVAIAGKLLKNDGLIGKVATNAQIDVQADAPLYAMCQAGEPVRVSLDVVTAATIRAKGIWVGIL